MGRSNRKTGDGYEASIADVNECIRAIWTDHKYLASVRVDCNGASVAVTAMAYKPDAGPQAAEETYRYTTTRAARMVLSHACWLALYGLYQKLADRLEEASMWARIG